MKKQEKKKSDGNRTGKDSLSVFLLPKERKRAKADLLVRVYRNHLVIDNGKSVICVNTNLPSTQRILQSIRENRLTQDLTDLLCSKNMLPNRNWINVKIVEIEDEKKNIRPQYVETVPLERRNGDLTIYIHRWIEENYPFSTQDEKLKIEADIVNTMHSHENLYFYPSPTFFRTANFVQYHQKKDRFRRRKRVEVPLKTFPFVGRPFRGIHPSSRVHFVYPHLLFKYIVKNKLHETPIPKPPSILQPAPSQNPSMSAPSPNIVKIDNPSSRSFQKPPTPSSILAHHYSNTNPPRINTPNVMSPSSGNASGNVFPFSGFGQPKTPYSNYVATPRGSKDKKPETNLPIDSGMFLKEWMKRYSKVKIATRHLLKPNQEVRLLCFRDVKGRVWTFELRSFLRAKAYFQYRGMSGRKGGRGIVYEARMRKSDEKTRPSLRMVIGRGHECYEEYIRRLKDLFAGRASIIYDQVLDYRTYLKSLAKGRAQRQQKKQHQQQKQQQQRRALSTNNPQATMTTTTTTTTTVKPHNNNNNNNNMMMMMNSRSNNNNNGLYIPPSPLSRPLTPMDPPFPFSQYLQGSSASASSSSSSLAPPPPPPPPNKLIKIKISSTNEVSQNESSNNNNQKKNRKKLKLTKTKTTKKKKKNVVTKKTKMKKNMMMMMKKKKMKRIMIRQQQQAQQQQQSQTQTQHGMIPQYTLPQHHQSIQHHQHHHHRHRISSDQQQPMRSGQGNRMISHRVPPPPSQEQQQHQHQQQQYRRMNVSSSVSQNSSKIRNSKKMVLPLTDSFRFSAGSN